MNQETAIIRHQICRSLDVELEILQKDEKSIVSKTTQSVMF